MSEYLYGMYVEKRQHEELDCGQTNKETEKQTDRIFRDIYFHI